MATAKAMAKAAWWWTAALLSIAVALFSYRYLVGIGMADGILANAFARPWLWLHVGGAATALLLGAFQFIPALRRGRVPAHRWIGRIYVVACLLGGVAGLVLAFGSTAGSVAGLGFGSLAIAWIIANVQGWRLALARDFAAHRRWMIRSWALTLAAVTLRLYMPLCDALGIPSLDAYRAISFLAWVPNLIVAELYLRVRLPADQRQPALA